MSGREINRRIGPRKALTRPKISAKPQVGGQPTVDVDTPKGTAAVTAIAIAVMMSVAITWRITGHSEVAVPPIIGRRDQSSRDGPAPRSLLVPVPQDSEVTRRGWRRVVRSSRDRATDIGAERR